MLEQIIVVNKEKGLTSRDVVNDLIKILNNKKVGHTGTLDPLASGVLVCLTGKYTKLVSMITNEEKEYIATIKLGIKTDTLDITGTILQEEKTRLLTKKEITETLNKFKGKYEEIVPLYSAVSVNGKRLYEYARKKEDVKLPTKEVEIKSIELLDYHDDLITFKTLVSKGTYIRSLIQSICDSLNVYGTMSDLIRTRQGKFSLNNSYTIEEIKNNKYQPLTLEDVIDLQIVNVNNDVLNKKIKNGNTLNLNYNGYILFKQDACDLALYYFENNLGKLKILFN